MNIEAIRIADDPLTQELLIVEPELKELPIAQGAIPEYITIEQAAIVAEVDDEDWVFDMINAENIRYTKTVEGNYLVETLSLLDYIEKFDKAWIAKKMRNRLDYLAGLNHVR